MDKRNTFIGLGPKEAEFVARLTYEKKTIISVREIDSFLPAGYKYRNQFLLLGENKWHSGDYFYPEGILEYRRG
ncbi:MAG: hypothetical protein ABII74_09480 [Elusimicrobiota bacterium]